MIDIGIPYGLADCIAVRGTGWLADHIVDAEMRLDSKLTDAAAVPSHVAGIINTDPSICIEALARVKTNPLDATLAGAKRAWLIHHKSLTDDQRAAVVYAACGFSADSYGWNELVLQGADSLFRDTFWTDRLSQMLKNRPICSYLWAAAYAKIGVYFGAKLIQSITPSDVLAAVQAVPAIFDVSEIML